MLKLLLKIQDYDSQIMELEMRQDFFPDLRKQLQEEMDAVRAEYKQKSERLSEVKKEIDMLELELESEREKLEKSRERLMHVTTNREYDAVQAEISTHEERIAEAEQRIIVLLDEQETLEREVEKLEEQMKRVVEENTARLKEIDRNAREITRIKEEISRKREELASKVTQSLMRRYEQIRGGRQGVAIVPIVDRACGGCRQALPPQRIQEIRAGNLVVCENCGRIIVDMEMLAADKDEPKEGGEGSSTPEDEG